MMVLRVSTRMGVTLIAMGLSAGLALCASSSALAQTAPPAPPTREEINRVPLGPDRRAPSRLTVEGGIERSPCPLAEPRFANVTVTISQVVFDHLRVVPPDELRSAWSDMAGKTVPIAAICDIRDAAATMLRRKGYLAAVQVPAQRIENGVVHFDVLMAKLVAVQVRGNAGHSEKLIAAYLSKLVGPDAFNEQQAARYLLLARDLPGYDVRLTLRPANAAPGDVVGEVTVVRAPLTLDANIQNYGSRDVGRFGGLIHGEAYDLLGGDRLSLGYFATADFKEQNVAQGSYDIRVGAEGLTLGGRLTYAWTRPDSGVIGTKIRANTLVAGGEASYPLLRTEPATVRAAMGLELIDQDVRIGQAAGLAGLRTRDHIRALYGRIDFDLTDRASIEGSNGYSVIEPRVRLGGSLEARKGLGILGASDSCGAPPYSRCASPARSLSHIEGRPQAALVRFVGQGEFRATPNISFYLSPRAQYTHKALLSYEEFSGGNYTVGRGYDPGAIIGDSGVGVQYELRVLSGVPRSRESFAFQPYGFFDIAYVWNYNSPVATRRPDPQRLASTGGGVRVTYGDRARLDATVAVPLERSTLQTRRGSTRFLISLTTKLLPWNRP